MSADMPCCPDKSAPMDCAQCPLMAICMVKTFHAPSSAGVVEIRPVTVRLLAPGSDPEAESLSFCPLQDLLVRWSVRLNAGRRAARSWRPRICMPLTRLTSRLEDFEMKTMQFARARSWVRSPALP